MFKRKKQLRINENAHLVEQTERQKERLDTQNELIAHSIEPSEDVLQRREITAALYAFLLREAKYQHNKKNKLS